MIISERSALNAMARREPTVWQREDESRPPFQSSFDAYERAQFVHDFYKICLSSHDCIKRFVCGGGFINDARILSALHARGIASMLRNGNLLLGLSPGRIVRYHA